MTAISSVLANALGSRYTIARELGRGGMAIVFLAQDQRHHRLVALKTLRPELVPALGPERFLREIQIAARLQHPHVLPLFDSGEAAGQLWYTMPYVEGESLRQRLEREGQLPIDEVIRISLNVLAALAYAHEHGIIHRDLKPENILLESGEAVVADFGIAHAVDAAGGDRLTGSGLALGTPAYMSPEQAGGRRQVDARSDIYAVGCVLYEMLAGEPPFSGTTPMALLARHAVDPVPPLHTLRSTIPDALERAVLKALAKVPADRFGTATEFAAALSASREAPSRPLRSNAGVRSRKIWTGKRPRFLGALSAVLAIAVAAALTLPSWQHSDLSTLDPKVVAVLPFRVAGADSSLDYLREGMVDLLATKLSGTKDLRTVDPRTMLRAWLREGGSPSRGVDRAGSLRLARMVGAGRLLEGEAVGTPNTLVLNAKLSDAAGGGEVRASVEGSSDSLISMVDRLAAQLLALGAAEEQHRLGALTTTSLPALRAYLDGRAAHRQGRYDRAREHFNRAIELDSSFALAGIGRSMAAVWLGEGYDGAGSRLAWRHRDRLSGRDFLLLAFMLGRHFPRLGNAQRDIVNAEAVVESAPDNPETWVLLADHTYHYGRLTGMADALQRSIQAYKRALDLDSTYLPAHEHLFELYYDIGDTVSARRALVLLLKLDSITPTPFRARAKLFARFLLDTTFGNFDLTKDTPLHVALSMVDAESVLTLRRAAITSKAEMTNVQQVSWAFYLIHGRPRRARAEMQKSLTPADRAAMMLDGLYADADSADATKIAAEVPRRFARPTATTSWETVVERFAVAQHDLAHGRTRAARDAVRVWKNVWNTNDTSQVRLLSSNLAILLDAQIAAQERRTDAHARLMELDSLLQAAPTYGEYLPSQRTFGGFEPLGNVLAARLWNDRGDSRRALESVRRRVAGLGLKPIYITSLREEGRYASLAEDRAGAIRAYRQYLTLRHDPELAVSSKVEKVRAELAALERESTDR